MSRLQRMLGESRALLGIAGNTTSHREKWVSSVGAFVGILAVYGLSLWYLADVGALLMLASMGASAVLLFAVPHGALSQPWAVIGGHVVSAGVGVTCQLIIPELFWASALAVGGAVAAMYYLRCIHPPGGATALAAVIGGPDVYALGYAYLITPVLMNALTIVLVAVLFNAIFPWRRYPFHWSRGSTPRTAPSQYPGVALTQEDLAAAMERLNSYVDITTEELTELMELAREHAERQVEHPETVLPGGFYSNGELGKRWCIRQVIDAEETGKSTDGRVIYKNIAGGDNYDTGLCTREEFRNWARFEVIEQNGRWVKKGL
ncbi:HPP family protein [Marinimicrobium sp. ABcell2]|uniref:HPP family protein n=1 Tax=Marinimicrobium sp. ABcell2 TaxID=3069751 RepID=UPI0027B3818E|nr:HPP family protein [Marinimicrobium sp. ABcell2]MDQ2076298.1 HPP family protein [Marinimicrobium sp. ABcell2]